MTQFQGTGNVSYIVFNFDGFSKTKCHIVNATFVVFSHISRELGMCRSALSSIFMQILKLLMLCLGSPGFFLILQ